MAKMRSRTEALVNAYLNNYQNANAATVSGGRSAQQSAQSRGSAIMNATDKTLPALKDYSADVLNGIIKSADNAQNTAISNFKLAKKQIEAEQKAAEKAAKAAAKSSGKSRSKKSGKKSSSTSSTDDASGNNTSLNSLFGGAASTSSGTTGSTAGSKPKADDTKKDSEKTKGKSAQEKYLESKKAGARTTAAKSYAERNGTGRVSAAQPAQSRAVARGGKVIGSSYAAAGSAPSAAETQAAKNKRNDYKSRQEDIAAALKKLQSDADYRAELAAPGRKLTGAEIQAVKEYNQKPGDLYKQMQAGELSLDDYNKQGQELARMNQKADLHGLGQDMQAFTAGLMTSVPFLKQVDSAIKDYGNKATNGQYGKSLESGAVADFLPALENSKEQNRIAAGAGTMTGKAAQYGLFNNLMEGTPLAETMGEVGGKVAGAASKVPVLGRFATPAAGEALGRILTDQTADTVLDTVPSLVNDLQTYDDQQSRIKNGEQVDDALTPGQIGLNTLGNVAQNLAFNAIPEVGGAVLNRLKGPLENAKAARDALDVEQARGMVDAYEGLQQNSITRPAEALNDVNTSIDSASALKDGSAVDDTGRWAVQNAENLPIDAQLAEAYNRGNGGVVNDNLGAGVRADVPGNADAGASYEAKPGGTGSGIAGQAAEAGIGGAASGNGAGVQGTAAENAQTVAEWAKSITGKNRQSVYTRRIEDLYARMQNGASRDELLEEAGNIAAGIVKERDFAEPLDEATTALRDYFKSTPVRLDEKAAGDILSASGLKSIQQYNFQNGTNFSLTKGVPYDSAMMELAEMGTGVKGTSVDDLMAAVQSSNAKPLVDIDMAAASTDYYRDAILNGPTGQEIGGEDFENWLNVQSFDRDAPDYVQRLLERDSIPALNQTTETVSEPVPGMGTANNARQVVQEQPLNGSESVPSNAIGAERTLYNREEVPNLDYANQRVMQGDMDAQTAAELGIGEQTHTVYSRAEGKDTASQDFDVLVQKTGSVTGAGRTVADELNSKIQNGQWDAADVYAGSHAAEQLRQRLAELPEGSAEADVVKAQIANINRAVSAGQSKAGQALVSGRYAQPDEYSGIRRFEQYTQNSVDRFANTRQGQQLHDVAQEVADTMNGPMDDEFTAFVHSQGVDTGDDVRDQLEYMAEQIQRMGRARNVNINEEQARAAAARLQAGGTVEDIYGAFARQALGIGDLSQEDLDYAVDTFRRISDMPDSRERYDLEMSVYGRMANYMPARGFADRLNNIRYLCMLGNSRTHIRNLMGNVMMGTVTRAKDNIAGVMQLALPQNERTKAVGTMLTADGRRMVNRARDYADNQMYSILYQDGRWNMDTGLQAARNTYTTPVGRAIGRLSDINGGALEAEDNFFLRSAFGNSMASFLKARGYDSSIFDATDEHSRAVLRQAAAQALEDAREATFHEDNFLSTAFRNFSNDTRRHGPAGQIAYAVTEGILPFKKTPINIAKNALEYNPVGGAVEAIYRGATGQGATRVMDAAAKGVTGTAILGAGYLLAKNGMLTGGASGDDRADNYNEMLGDQNYAVKIPGKGTYTLDWASPSSVPLLIGAQIAKDQEDGGEFNLTQTLDRMRQITQPVLETTMLQGLNDTLDSVSYADSNDKLATLATSALGSFANQFVPTALGQVARTVDDTRRSSYGGGDTKTERDIGYNIRKMESKIPGLSKESEPYIDQWGREEASLDGTDDSAEGMFLRGAYNMLSPGYVSSESITPVDEYLQGLYGSTNDSHVLPEKASSKITVDSKDYYMTPEEKTEYAKTSGQTAYDIIDSLRQNDMFLKLPEDQQSALVQEAYSVAKTVGGVAAVGDGVSGTNSKAYEAYQQGGVPTLKSYLLAKNATDIARDEKREATGSDTASLDTVETWNTLYSQFGDDAIPQFVDTSDDDSAVRRIDQYAGDNGVSAYMRAYSAVANTLKDGQTPNKYYVGIGMQKYGLNGEDFARAYLAAYSKTDKKGAEMYKKYGVDGLKGWVEFKAYADADGNGHLKKTEVTDQLNKMSLTEQLYNAYYNAAMGK
jgi:hypothetical protein|uniref:Uncharacterized protein n=1 Tax=Ackermannviridae sp. TaxID=2831612 RepID=A0A8S5VVX2_9CAUD|nr:MAG TPA: hypothetical protein [Ackermannviridae sp.]